MICFKAEILFKNVLVFSIFSLLAFGSFAQQKNLNLRAASQSNPSSYSTQKITYKLFNTSNNRYGYDIFIDKSLFIHQPVIPCKSGNMGFNSKADAQKVAILVIDKIRKGIIPPSVTLSELQKIAIDLR